MAKDATLVIHVGDDEFKAFIKNFNAFVQRMNGLTEQWKKIGDSIDKTTKSTKELTTTTQSLTQSLKGIHSQATGITKQIFKWGGLVAGIGTLLGGGGLFGLGRLSDRLVQQQKFAQGIGSTDIAGTRAVTTFGASILNDPKALLESIGKAQTNFGSASRIAMQNLFGSDFAAEIKKKPEEIAPDLIEKLLPKVREWTGGKTENIGIAMSTHMLGSLGLTAQDVRRMMEHPDEFRDATQRMRKQLAQGPTPEQQQAWDKFWQAVKDYQNTLENELLKKLAPIAEAMTPVSEGFTKLTEAFFKMDEVQAGIADLASWMKDFGEYLKQDKTQEHLKTLIDGLTVSLKVLWDVLHPFQGLKDLQDYTIRKGAELLGKPDPYKHPEAYPLKPRLPGEPAPQQPTTPSGKPIPRVFMPHATTPPPPAQQTPFPGGTTLTPSPPFSMGAARSFVPSLPGMTSTDRFPTPARSNGFSFSNMNLSSVTPSSSAPSSTAVERMVPQQQGTAITGIMNQFAQNFNLAGPGGGQQGQGRGPLDIDNWQSTRVSNLIVRGVPSANLFIGSTGLAAG